MKIPQSKVKEKPKEEKERVDKKLEGPGKYEITKDTTFKVKFVLTMKDGRWVVIQSDEKERTAREHWVEFRMWTFDEEIELRKMATQWDVMKKIHLIDHDLLNQMKIQRLMKSWSFEEENARLKLLHANGILSDESFGAFKKLHPNIARHIIEKMNGVLEYNE